MSCEGNRVFREFDWGEEDQGFGKLREISE